jgi:hypothetical protein
MAQEFIRKARYRLAKLQLLGAIYWEAFANIPS